MTEKPSGMAFLIKKASLSQMRHAFGTGSLKWKAERLEKGMRYSSSTKKSTVEKRSRIETNISLYPKFCRQLFSSLFLIV